MGDWEERKPPRLSRDQWDALYIQLSATPDPDEGFSETGEHWKLISLLNGFGFSPHSRKEAFVLGQRLIDEGYREEDL